MGFSFTPIFDLEDTTREEFFADYATQRKVYLAERGGFDVTVDEEGVSQVIEREVSKERAVTIGEPNRRVEVSELGTAAKRVYLAAESLGLEVHAWLVTGEVAPVLYVADSKEGEPEHAAGDVRFEAFHYRRYCVEAAHRESGLAFQAHYLGKGDGITGAFDHARVLDPLGIEVENWVDYTKDKTEAKALNWTEEQRIQFGMAMNRRINDGSVRVERAVYFTAGNEFTTWLDDFLAAKGLKTLTPKRRPKFEEEGYWHG